MARRLLQVLEFEQQYLDAMPSAQMYERSYMHRDAVTNVAVRVALACRGVEQMRSATGPVPAGCQGAIAHIECKPLCLALA
jgi:hypothetical protein